MKTKGESELGCLGFVLSCFFVAALLWGVTIDGVHYQIGCDCGEGVKFESTDVLR